MASEFLPNIDASKCMGCGVCVKVCPNNALVLANNLPAIAHPEACDYVGACQEICPTGAISLMFEIVISGE